MFVLLTGLEIAALIGAGSKLFGSLQGSRDRGRDREQSREQFFSDLISQLLLGKEGARQGREGLRQQRERTQLGAPFRKGAANILLNQERPTRTDLSSVFEAVADNPFFKQPDDEALGLDPGGGFRLPADERPVDLDVFDVPVTDEEVGLPDIDEEFADVEGRVEEILGLGDPLEQFKEDVLSSGEGDGPFSGNIGFGDQEPGSAEDAIQKIFQGLLIKEFERTGKPPSSSRMIALLQEAAAIYERRQGGSG